MKNFSRNIRLAREFAGLNQPELARRIGLTKSTISQWEGVVIKKVDGENLLKAASVLKVSPWWLIYGTDDAEAEVARCSGYAPAKIPAPSDDEAEALVSLFRAANSHAKELAVHALSMGQGVSQDTQEGHSFGERAKALVDAIKKGQFLGDRPQSR